MSLNHEGPPPGGDEPPFDPYEDTRRPHQDVAAERAVLGALILDPTLAPTLALELEPGDFYRPEHATIWNAAHQLAATGQPLDAITLAGHLTRTGQAKNLTGGPLYIHTLMAECPTPAAAPAYAKQVRDASRLRTVNNTAIRLRQLADTTDLDKVDAVLSEALQTLDDTVLRFGPRTTTAAATGLRDLSWLNGGTPPKVPPPTILHRSDGHAIFYAGQVNGLIGDPETAKTWIAQAAGVEALNAGGTFAMIDVDHNGPSHTTARLVLLGARMEHLADPARFRYYEPEDAEELRNAVDDIVTFAPTVLIVDSIGEVFPMLGVNTNDSDEITTALRNVCTRPATAGSCVITIDHLPKGHDARSTGFAIGSIAKKRMIRGAYLRVEAKVKPVPGGRGLVTMRIEKDSSGELRRSSNGGYAGTFSIDSTEAHVTTWAILRDTPRNDDGTFRPTNYMEKVAAFVAENAECSQNDIEVGVPGTAKHIRAALQILVTEGHISRQPGPRRSWKHTLTIPYREAEDDQAQPAL